jgi:hypothetical protein
MDFKARREHYNRCDPDEALDSRDPRNVDLDALPGCVRGANWASRLGTHIELSNKPVLQLFDEPPQRPQQ